MPNDAVLLIDLSSIGHPIWHMSQKEPDPDYTSQRTVAAVRKLAADHPHTAICCDSAKSFRRELDSTYKANRPPAEAPLHHQIDLAREALEADGFPVWCVAGFEGDDLIATATRLLTATRERAVLIASADKDLLALVSDRVEVHSTRMGNRIGPAEVKDKLGIEPCQVADYLTLMGDSSDNIQGAKGIGPKHAAGLLNIFGNLDDVYLALDNGDAGTLVVHPAQRASLAELRPRLESVRFLVRMRTDVPLDVSAVFKPRVPKVVENFMEEGEEMDKTYQQLAQAEKAGLLQPTRSGLPERGLGTKKKQTPVEIEAARRFLGSLPSTPTGTPTGTTPIPERVLGQEFPRPLPKPEAPGPATAALIPSVAPAPDEWERGLEPRSMDDAVRLAQRLHDSRMFSAYGTPQGVLSTVLLGRELGLPAMASLRSVHIIEGKHSLSADLMVALVLKSGLAEFFQLVESTDEICTFETKRKGTPKATNLSYTIAQAKQAGLLNASRSGRLSNWDKMPKQMLRARCKSELARLEYPDLLAGLYTPEELRDANGS